jgi:hypothetical protein
MTRNKQSNYKREGMKKIFSRSRASIVLIIFLITNYTLANDCCNDTFDCGSWWLQADAGVYPTLWRSRGDVFLNACDCATNVAAVGTNLGEFPKFSKAFKTPWIVGIQLGYAWSECIAFYGELNYIQAKAKSTAFNTVAPVNSSLLVRLNKYSAVSGYVGARYYTNLCWCDALLFFIGAKLGFIHRANIQASSLASAAIVDCGCPSVFKRDIFRHATKISGGANIGFDYCWCNNWSLVLTAEVVASKGPRGNSCVSLTTAEIVQLSGGGSLAVGSVKTEISFPVTFGLKYNF